MTPKILFAAGSCKSQFSMEGVFSEQEIAARRSGGFEGRLASSYSAFAQLRAALLPLSEGESLVVGTRGRFDDIQDFIVARKTDNNVKLFTKRKHFTIAEARAEFYLMLEREALAAAGQFGDLKFPRVIAFEGNEIYFEYVEGVNIKEVLFKMPFNEKQESIFLKFAETIRYIKTQLDDATDALDGTRSFEVWNYTKPGLSDRNSELLFSFASRDQSRSVEGGLQLIDVNRDGKDSVIADLGFEIFSLSTFNMIVTPNGDIYHSGGHPTSVQWSAEVLPTSK